MRLEGSSPEVGSLLPSRGHTFERLPIRSPDGDQIREAMKGKLATGELLEVHETRRPGGGMLHAAHHHVHFEMWLTREEQ
jgi:hypothetical protein